MGHLNSFLASGGGKFEQKFSKNSNAWGVARGGEGVFKLRFDWYIYMQNSTLLNKETSSKEKYCQ